MANGVPCRRIPIMLTMIGALGEISKGRPPMPDVWFMLTGGPAWYQMIIIHGL